ncbi:hypothetical protein [Capnocytophaga canis]|uniref:hypothetical protein n=1 Tax=Capnocytophaga canis TaxID=1848903 RepID=UPI001562E9D2|nr:hypothetical protein [Capnocytophaga canis]
MNYKAITFSIICDDEKYLEETLNWYNNTYGTDFKITNVIYDEVTFVDISSTKITLTDVFDIGYHFGLEIQKLREKGKIDW